MTKEKTVKVIKWFNKKANAIFYGLDIFINNEWAHVKQGKEPLFFTERNEANKKKRELQDCMN